MFIQGESKFDCPVYAQRERARKSAIGKKILVECDLKAYECPLGYALEHPGLNGDSIMVCKNDGVVSISDLERMMSRELPEGVYRFVPRNLFECLQRLKRITKESIESENQS